jgi:hypothetical protein
MAGIASVADPFRLFGDRDLIGWPTAGFARDWSALSHDFWSVLADYTVDAERGADDPPRLFDPDAIVR